VIGLLSSTLLHKIKDCWATRGKGLQSVFVLLLNDGELANNRSRVSTASSRCTKLLDDIMAGVPSLLQAVLVFSFQLSFVKAVLKLVSSREVVRCERRVHAVSIVLPLI
jgi:hypothetical protein